MQIENWSSAHATDNATRDMAKKPKQKPRMRMALYRFGATKRRYRRRLSAEPVIRNFDPIKICLVSLE